MVDIPAAATASQLAPHNCMWDITTKGEQYTAVSGLLIHNRKRVLSFSKEESSVSGAYNSFRSCPRRLCLTLPAGQGFN